jgi:hypothetical protein
MAITVTRRIQYAFIKAEMANGNLESKPGTRRISNETKCPIHPNGNHAWVDCYQNVANKDKKKPAAVPSSKGKGKSKSAVVDTNSMQCNDNKSLT